MRIFMGSPDSGRTATVAWLVWVILLTPALAAADDQTAHAFGRNTLLEAQRDKKAQHADVRADD
jgi:hypothetical protein